MRTFQGTKGRCLKASICSSLFLLHTLFISLSIYTLFSCSVIETSYAAGCDSCIELILPTPHAHLAAELEISKVERGKRGRWKYEKHTHTHTHTLRERKKMKWRERERERERGWVFIIHPNSTPLGFVPFYVGSQSPNSLLDLSFPHILQAIMYLRSKDFTKATDILKAFEKKESRLLSTAAANLSFLYILVRCDRWFFLKGGDLAVGFFRSNVTAIKIYVIVFIWSSTMKQQREKNGVPYFTIYEQEKYGLTLCWSLFLLPRPSGGTVRCGRQVCWDCH